MNTNELFSNKANDCSSCSSKGCNALESVKNGEQHQSLLSRRSFGQTILAASAGALLFGCSESPKKATEIPVKPDSLASGLSPALNVVQKSKGPILTVLEEFYKIGPGPSSSHTMGPMRITYDFFQRISKLPEDQLKRATALKVHLFGSLSATGKGHGTDRAALAGLLGKSPATCPPEFLDALASNPDEIHQVTIGPATLDLTIKDIIFDAPKGEFYHPNTMTAKLLAGNETLYELEYYSVGGGFIEWKGYEAPKKGQPKYPYAHAGELKKYIIDDNIPLAKLLLENEMAISGKSEKEISEFLDQVIEVMLRGVETGLKTDSILPGPIKLHSKAAELQRNLKNTKKGEAGKTITKVASYAFAMSEENARGHIIVTAPTAGSAGIIPAVLKSLKDLNIPDDNIREGFLAAAAIGYLCKHNATLSGAEGGCQAEVGVGSAMGAAMIAQAMGYGPKVVSNAAESALEHHLGMTCDPVAGYVQVPCIERCAYGAIKAWTAFCIASEEIPEQRRVDLDTTIAAMAQTAKDMNTKYKETSEGGLAVSVVLC
ncbi:L-serine ammonia-lyase [Flavihumibacter profundi]|uniref:L-serine ammonia-lyase n=1 Tax=Flavihumibacter profundi TaxID=2716883 RepID=UPI001CC3A0C2|nr:L-serine ammonia-lyase [Flavihumibacter profundi]MBZ5856951.1 L-serine ammonia-lyase [Flavihumibacter profundi]